MQTDFSNISGTFQLSNATKCKLITTQRLLNWNILVIILNRLFKSKIMLIDTLGLQKKKTNSKQNYHGASNWHEEILLSTKNLFVKFNLKLFHILRWSKKDFFLSSGLIFVLDVWSDIGTKEKLVYSLRDSNIYRDVGLVIGSNAMLECQHIWRKKILSKSKVFIFCATNMESLVDPARSFIAIIVSELTEIIFATDRDFLLPLYNYRLRSFSSSTLFI